MHSSFNVQIVYILSEPGGRCWRRSSFKQRRVRFQSHFGRPTFCLLARPTTPSGQSTNVDLLTKDDSSLVTTYTIPRILLNPASSQKVILHVKPKAEGLLTVDGLGFEIRLSKSESSGVGPGVAGNIFNKSDQFSFFLENVLLLLSIFIFLHTLAGKVLFKVQGPRLNSNQMERASKTCAADKRLEIQIAAPMPKLNIVFQNLPEFQLSGEIRHVSIEMIHSNPQIGMTDAIIASNDPLHVVIDLPRITLNSKYEDSHVALYAWDISKKTTSMWLRGSEEVGLRPFDLVFYYAKRSA